MKRIFEANTLIRQIMLAAGLLALTTSCSSDETESDLSSAIYEYLDTTQPNESAGLSILIKHKGQLVFHDCRGLARLIDMYPVDIHTGFRTASVTKPFTALAVMQLIEAQKMNLDDKIVDLLPNLPETYGEITVDHLLSHRAGLLDYIDDNNDLTALDEITISQVTNMLSSSGLQNLQFAPGSAGDYSNTGYVLLAMIIEKISGLSYPEYMKTYLFDPIGMNDSFVISEQFHMGDHNDNYALSKGKTLNVLGFNSLLYGPNGVVSSTYDLGLFADALLRGDIVSQASLTLMTTTHSSLPGVSDYGYGWLTGSGDYWHNGIYSDPNDFWHTGGFDGYRSVFYINPDMDLQVIILSNNGQTSQDQMFEIMRLTRDYLKTNP